MAGIKPLKQILKEHILKVWQKTGHDQAQTEQILGVKPGDLPKLFSQHKISSREKKIQTKVPKSHTPTKE